VIKKYAGTLAYWVSEPDRGQTDALIKGFTRSTGDIQGWLCSDDVLERGALRQVARFFMKYPQAQVVYGDNCFIDRTGKVIKIKRHIGFYRWIWLHDGNYIPQPSTFWRRELYDKVGGLDDSFDIGMDADLWLRFAEVTKIWHVRSLWSRMRMYPTAKSWNIGPKAYQEGLRINSRGFKKNVLRIENGLMRWTAGALRAICELAISVIYWLGPQTESHGPDENPFFGISQSCKRWFAKLGAHKEHARKVNKN